MLSKSLADCIRKYLHVLISSKETAYVEGGFISKGRILFSDILEVTTNK